MMKLDRKRAELELERAGKLNPGKWTDHSRYTAQACENIAARCDGMSPDTAYCYGLLHDIGRYAGVTSRRLPVLYGAWMGESGTDLYLTCIYDTGYQDIDRNF